MINLDNLTEEQLVGVEGLKLSINSLNGMAVSLEKVGLDKLSDDAREIADAIALAMRLLGLPEDECENCPKKDGCLLYNNDLEGLADLIFAAFEDEDGDA